MRSKAWWLNAGKFGLMVHWIAPGPLPAEGEHITDLNAAVDRFNLDLFLGQFAKTGADWLIFTIGQNTACYASPNSVLDRLAGPGHCSRRDLMLEIAQGVHSLGKRFIAYMTAEVKAPTVLHRPFAWNPADQSEFQRRYTSFIREYSLRLGKLADGWWFDGCYTWPEFHNSLYQWDLWLGAARAGNPDAAVAFNDGSLCCGITTPVSERHDYLAGETEAVIGGKIRLGGRRNQPSTILDPRTHSPQPPPSCLWHALVPIDCMWGHGGRGEDWQCLPYTIPAVAPGEMERPIYSLADLQTLVRDFKAAGGGVTFNVGIFQEGGLGPRSVDQLAELSRRLQGRDHSQ